MKRPKILAGVQPFYIPWKGYFDLIASADEFIIGDDLQFVRHGWCNRNRIKTSSGPRWLTIPVAQKGRSGQKLNTTTAVSNTWINKHLNALSLSYSKAPHWREYQSWLTDLYAGCQSSNLASIDVHFTTAICELLKIKTPVTLATAYDAPAERNERIIFLCKAVDASVYLSGPAAETYIDLERFTTAGIEVRYKRYDFEPYSQLYPPFEHGVTILDVILNCGPDTPAFISSK